VSVQNPDGVVNSNRLQIVAQPAGGSPTTNLFTFLSANQDWQLISGNNMATNQNTTVWTNSGTLRITTNQVYDGVTSRKTIRKYQTFDWGESLIEETRNPGTNQLQSTHTYWTNSTDYGYRKPKQIILPSGDWRSYDYDSSQRVAKVWSAFLNQAPTSNSNLCRVVTYDYTPLAGSGDPYTSTNRARTTVTWLLGREVARSYLVLLPGAKKEIQCQWPADVWSSASNLITATTYYTNGLASNLVASVQWPDSSFDLYQYATNSTQRTNTVWHGQASAGVWGRT
jgi:hypothetical protein